MPPAGAAREGGCHAPLGAGAATEPASCAPPPLLLLCCAVAAAGVLANTANVASGSPAPSSLLKYVAASCT